MMQLDLISPSVSAARLGRDVGMRRAIDHADRVVENWSDIAYQFLLDFVGHNPKSSFLTETVRLAAENAGLPVPPDNRAWGAVASRAVRGNIIVRIGYAPAKTGHCRPMPLWLKK